MSFLSSPKWGQVPGKKRPVHDSDFNLGKGRLHSGKSNMTCACPMGKCFWNLRVNPWVKHVIMATQTFEGGHPVCELHLFAGCINRSSQIIQDQWGWLIHLSDLHFSTVTQRNELSQPFLYTFVYLFENLEYCISSGCTNWELTEELCPWRAGWPGQQGCAAQCFQEPQVYQASWPAGTRCGPAAQLPCGPSLLHRSWRWQPAMDVWTASRLLEGKRNWREAWTLG